MASIWRTAVLRKACIREIFWLLPSVALGHPIPSLLNFHIIITRLEYTGLWEADIQPSLRLRFSSSVYIPGQEAGDWESTSADLAPIHCGVGGGGSRLIIATVVGKNNSRRSVLNWPPCDQFACWISTVSTFYIQWNTLCPLNAQGYWIFKVTL